MMKIKSKYTTAQLLRFPLLFAGILGAFMTGFMYRREYFGKEIEAVRVRNEDDIRKRHEIMAQAKERVAAEVAARAKAKGKGDMIGNSGSQ